MQLPNGSGRRRFSLKALATLATGGLLASAATASYAFGVEPAWIELVPLSLPLPRLAPAFDGYRIVLFSDIHLGDGLDRDRLETIVGMVNGRFPDLVAITGDFVTRDGYLHAPALAAALGNLSARDGAVAVLGNHDYGAGVDDVMARKARLDQVLAALPTAGTAILLAHEPDFADSSAATGRFDLQLSGHSHGGQVVLPFHGPLYLPPFAERYPSGRYQVGRMVQYTTRGVGTEKLRVRFRCRPEITVLTLHAPGCAASQPI